MKPTIIEPNVAADARILQVAKAIGGNYFLAFWVLLGYGVGAQPN